MPRLKSSGDVMKEVSIQEDNRKYAEELHIITRFLNFRSQCGWPDMAYLYRGRVLFIEYKRLGERPEPLQTYVHNYLRKAGFEVDWVDVKEIGRKYIKDWKDNVDRYNKDR